MVDDDDYRGTSQLVDPKLKRAAKAKAQHQQIHEKLTRPYKALSSRQSLQGATRATSPSITTMYFPNPGKVALSRATLYGSPTIRIFHKAM
ncbi:hypothetical protein K474DRAFT_1666704 [Panus rudis PR-1116 ss-1]|nr:hypothetical protein K474DRAFT_1666704 [Panus rudis PR-1116 ss-1]